MSMMECPRCGFQQPSDRYCANCGLDVEHFEPTPPPWHEQLLKNSTFHLSLALVLIGGMGFYIYSGYKSQSQPSALSEQSLAPSTSGQQQTAPANRARSANPSESALGTQPRQERDRGATAQSGSKTETLNPDASAASQPPETSNLANSQDPATSGFTQKTMPTRLNIMFYEVSRELLLQILDLSEPVSETSNSRVLVFPSYKQLQNLLSSAHRLPGTRSSGLSANNDIYISYGPDAQGGNESQGLSLQVTPVNVETTGVELDLQGRLSLSQQEGQPLSEYTLVDGTYQFPPKAALVLAGLIPHEPLPESAESSLLRSPLAIMTSPDFLSSNSPTEFLMVIQAQ